jgi:HD-GYP domain-containing protein (c-di-GMP phosphodiesterase class II)
MRLRTRAFLLCFVPFVLLLTGSFWAIRKVVQTTVKEGLRSSLRENHLSIARLRSRSDLQNSRFLKVVGENASLKAVLQLVLSNPSSSDARETVGDQLRELCEQMGFDFLLISDAGGNTLAGVIRTGAEVRPLVTLPGHSPRNGLMVRGDMVYQIASVPIDQGDENIGELSVGERFDVSDFNTPAVLLRNGKVLKSSIPGIALQQMEAALKGCPGADECEVRLGDQSYISLPLRSIALGDGYVVRSLQNVDAATGPVQSILNRAFLLASVGAVLAVLLFSVLSAQNIVGPIAGMIAHLRRSENTGLLPEFGENLSPVREIQDLTSSFNRAAAAIREARHSLQGAYLEFVGSLASALDARDGYTAGHSGRVSEVACAIATAMGIAGDELNDIRIGALLHDIGKIGISDTVLQKPGKLTEQEFALVRQHPVIGRRILEGVQGFAAYLPAVELHHENWDGTGYPRGERGETTPVAARIIHVADAYDAMTTDRPYRRGMSQRDAIGILRTFAGRQFDPRVVEIFITIASAFAPAVNDDKNEDKNEKVAELEFAGTGKT